METDHFDELENIMTIDRKVYEPYALDPIIDNTNRQENEFSSDDSSENSSDDMESEDCEDSSQDPPRFERASLDLW